MTGFEIRLQFKPCQFQKMQVSRKKEVQRKENNPSELSRI